MDATQKTLDHDQCWILTDDIRLRVHVELMERDINKYELAQLMQRVIQPRIRAILCTLTNATYEDIIKVVHDKLNLDDLFDNRHKYLD
jgi:hypothetical protein